MPPSPPDVFGYLAYREFLKDWFAAQKQINRRYSHRLFARMAGVRSPSLLSEVISGRRNLTPRTLEGFTRALKLNSEEASFFGALVRLDQAADAEEKTRAWEQVAASRRFRSARPIDEGVVRYLSNWYYPATRELALCADFQADPDWVADRLNPKITRAQARDALDTLFELGMLVTADGRTRPAEVSVATPHELADIAIYNYHRAMLQRALDALSITQGAEERHYCAVTVGIPRSLVPRLKAELDAFQERLLHLCDEHADDAERVYQLNLQLLPLSRTSGDAP